MIFRKALNCSFGIMEICIRVFNYFFPKDNSKLQLIEKLLRKRAATVTSCGSFFVKEMDTRMDLMQRKSFLIEVFLKYY